MAKVMVPESLAGKPILLLSLSFLGKTLPRGRSFSLSSSLSSPSSSLSSSLSPLSSSSSSSPSSSSPSSSLSSSLSFLSPSPRTARGRRQAPPASLSGIGKRSGTISAVALEAITDEQQFDDALAQAKLHLKPIIIDWMAAWCRKCIYLQPKLEKLAAEYHPDVKFYCVDVNTVPSALVRRADVTKMPTIQLWSDGEKKDEVIGGHKPWMVLEEIKEMIQKHSE